MWPPLFSHAVCTVTPEVVSWSVTGSLPNPATLPLTVSVAVLPEIVLLIVGVPTKCGLAANASIGANKTSADVTTAAGMPNFVILAVMFPQTTEVMHSLY